jgi:hypothetical protein
MEDITGIMGIMEDTGDSDPGSSWAPPRPWWIMDVTWSSGATSTNSVSVGAVGDKCAISQKQPALTNLPKQMKSRGRHIVGASAKSFWLPNKNE